MGKYIVVTDDKQPVLLKTEDFSIKVKHGQVIYNDEIAKIFPSILIPVDKNIIDDIIEPIIDISEKIEEKFQEFKENVSEIIDDVKEDLNEVKEFASDVIDDIKEETNQHFNKKVKK